MTGVSGPRRAARSDDAIQIGAVAQERQRQGVRFDFLLLVFMRLVAALWMWRGLVLWRVILMSDMGPFDAMTSSASAALIYFAVVDLLAAVGMWLANPWGGALWLFAAASGLLATAISPDAGIGGFASAAADLISMAIYFWLSWRAAREANT